MGQGFKALALGALLAANSIAAEAAVWKVEGFFNFAFEPGAGLLGYRGEAFLEYSARVSTKDLKNFDESCDEVGCYFLVSPDVKGSDRVNGGALTPMIPSLTVLLYQPYEFCDECEPIPEVPDAYFLTPWGGSNWGGGGQFIWNSGFDRSAFFEFDGHSWSCDSDGTESCRSATSDLSPLAFFYGVDFGGTVTRVAEPASVALLLLGLAGLGITRQRRA